MRVPRVTIIVLIAGSVFVQRVGVLTHFVAPFDGSENWALWSLEISSRLWRRDLLSKRQSRNRTFFFPNVQLALWRLCGFRGSLTFISCERLFSLFVSHISIQADKWCFSLSAIKLLLLVLVLRLHVEIRYHPNPLSEVIAFSHWNYRCSLAHMSGAEKVKIFNKTGVNFTSHQWFPLNVIVIFEWPRHRLAWAFFS